VVTLLTKGKETLPNSSALLPFWKKLEVFDHQFKLVLPNLFFPDGDEVTVKSAGYKDEGSQSVKVTPHLGSRNQDGTVDAHLIRSSFFSCCFMA